MIKLNQYIKSNAVYFSIGVGNNYVIDNSYCIYSFGIAGHSWYFYGPAIFQPDYSDETVTDKILGTYRQRIRKEYSVHWCALTDYIYFSYGRTDTKSRQWKFVLPWRKTK